MFIQANDYVEKTVGKEGEAHFNPYGHFESDQEVEYLNLDTIKKPAEEFMKPIRNFPGRVSNIDNYK